MAQPDPAIAVRSHPADWAEPQWGKLKKKSQNMFIEWREKTLWFLAKFVSLKTYKEIKKYLIFMVVSFNEEPEYQQKDK